MDSITLEMGGKPRYFHFGIGFIGETIEALGIGFGELKEAVRKNPFRVIPKMLLESYRIGCLYQDKECDITIKDVYGWIDQEEKGIGSENVIKFLKAFEKSQKKDTPEDEGKSKPVAKKGKN